MTMKTGTLVFGLLCAGAAYGQTWEIGGVAGFGTVPSRTATNTAGASAQAGFVNGLTFGAGLSQRLYEHVTGEVRYMYRAADLKLSGNGQEPRLGAESHSMFYDLLLLGGKSGASVRPFVAAGAGARFYRATENPPIFQPLNTIAVLTRTTEWDPMISLGGGVKFKLSRRALFRLDFRDYLTPVPEKLFATRSTSQLKGWFHDLVFTGGISYTFHEPGY